MAGRRGHSDELAGRGGRRGGRTGGRSPIRDSFLQAGILIGAGVGAAVIVLGRRAEQSARRGLIDWPAAERIAVSRVRHAPGALSAAEIAAAGPAYVAAMERIVPALSAALQTELPGIVGRSGVVDRAGWVHANVTTFAGLIARIEGRLLDEVLPPGAGLVKSTMAIANRMITTRQFGFLLGFLGGRVLGQYDLALLTAETTPGQLLFVEENIRRTATALDVPLESFRTWIALHESTHAFEFEAHPWLRPYLSARLEHQLASLSTGTSMLSGDALKRLGRALRGQAPAGQAPASEAPAGQVPAGEAPAGETWMEGLMSEEQKREFREIQAVMSLLEGFGDYVMDEVGRELVADVATISARFHARREQRTTFERAMMRITGMDLKMEQYRKGEEFVAAIARTGGAEALRTLWLGPQTLPTPEEIDMPSRWVERVMGVAS